MAGNGKVAGAGICLEPPLLLASSGMSHRSGG